MSTSGNLHRLLMLFWPSAKIYMQNFSPTLQTSVQCSRISWSLPYYCPLTLCPTSLWRPLVFAYLAEITLRYNPWTMYVLLLHCELLQNSSTWVPIKYTITNVCMYVSTMLIVVTVNKPYNTMHSSDEKNHLQQNSTCGLDSITGKAVEPPWLTITSPSPVFKGWIYQRNGESGVALSPLGTYSRVSAVSYIKSCLPSGLSARWTDTAVSLVCLLPPSGQHTTPGTGSASIPCFLSRPRQLSHSRNVSVS